MFCRTHQMVQFQVRNRESLWSVKAVRGRWESWRVSRAQACPWGSRGSLHTLNREAFRCLPLNIPPIPLPSTHLLQAAPLLLFPNLQLAALALSPSFPPGMSLFQVRLLKWAASIFTLPSLEVFRAKQKPSGS